MTDTPELKPLVADLLQTQLVELQLFVSSYSIIMEDNGIECFGYGDLLQAMIILGAPKVEPLDERALEDIMDENLYSERGDVRGIDESIKAILSALGKVE